MHNEFPELFRELSEIKPECKQFHRNPDFIKGMIAELTVYIPETNFPRSFYNKLEPEDDDLYIAGEYFAVNVLRETGII